MNPLGQRVAYTSTLLLALWVADAPQLDETETRIVRVLFVVHLLVVCAAACLWIFHTCLGEAAIVLLFPPEDEGIPDTEGEDGMLLEADADGITDDDDNDEFDPASLSNPSPTPLRVLLIALDLLIAILATLVVCGLTHNMKVLSPTWLLLAGAVGRSLYPWRQRRSFWKVLAYTLMAPYYRVQFRDGMVGDVLTSLVRPFQNVLLLLPPSWVLFTVLLPMATVTPLFLRFLQCLRQVWDSGERWPALVNAGKYFVAAHAALGGVFGFGMAWWVSSVISTMYQLAWDITMDWNLLDRNGKLRRKRLYPFAWMYWVIAALNGLLRFGWTLTFVPAQYLDATGVLTQRRWVLGPILAVAEIIRRSLWALIRVEWEVIRTTRSLDDMPLQKMASESASETNKIRLLVELGLYTVCFGLMGLVAAFHRGTY